MSNATNPRVSFFTVGVDFCSLLNEKTGMTHPVLTLWKYNLAQSIQFACNNGRYVKAGGHRLWATVLNPQDTKLYINFFEYKTPEETLSDVYWDCLWGITQKIIIPAVIQTGHKPWDIKITLSYTNKGQFEQTDIYPIRRNKNVRRNQLPRS